MQDVSYDSSGAAAMGGAFVVLMVFYVAVCVLMIVCGWKVFEKAGKPGWASIIPIYSLIVMLEIVGKPWWYIFMFLIPIYGWIVLPIMLTHDLSKSFGKDVGFTVGLLLLGIIFYPILAFSKDIRYIGPAGRPTGASLDSQIGSIGNPAV
ncbi:DUF5684 domain-containing protein [Chitinophaga filiformis]|uniref:Signal peptidase I n=1 Tax=Chitinophaga filiformis TaxID=104663 RepID=A0A1G7WRT0_CHIFI|nr:DUF5684 domain-containing protein [Chitinophaga filiformis]SDG74633.1 hypothetical protein SAMN04488121_106130 [Chitinophaga filiformis]